MNAKEEKLKNLIFFKILLTGKRILKNKIRWRSQWQFFFWLFYSLCALHLLYNEWIYFQLLLPIRNWKKILFKLPSMADNEWMNECRMYTPHINTLVVIIITHKCLMKKWRDFDQTNWWIEIFFSTKIFLNWFLFSANSDTLKKRMKLNKTKKFNCHIITANERKDQESIFLSNTNNNMCDWDKCDWIFCCWFRWKFC